MPPLSIEFDWVDAEGVRGPELCATWASLQIKAADSVVTRVLDTRAKTVRDFVYVPIYPLAEWLVTNWWFLTHEFGSPAKEGNPDFHRRHSLGANREGYAFPSLDVVSSGSWTHLTWKRDQSPWTKVEFLEQGELWMDSDEFRERCADVIDRVIRRLVSMGVDGTFLQEEWEAIQTADKDEAQFCQTAAGLGWDPYALDDRQSHWVIMFADSLGRLLGEAVPAVNAEDSDEEWFGIADALWRTKKHRSLPLHRILSLRHEAYPDEIAVPLSLGIFHEHLEFLPDAQPRGVGYPWHAGYNCARRLRQHLNLDGQPLPTMPHLAEALGEDAGSIRKVTRPLAASSGWPALVDGIITRTDDGSPAFALRALRGDSQRFHFCRALGEVLLSPDFDTLLTKTYSERQQRNRAFAAEFLAPASGLRDRIPQPVVDADDIDELAVEYGVSPYVIEHQVKNHRIARVSAAVDPAN
ncbi:MAG: ImmA/IrrE family metallo-endopeptidase [Deltaproteobacteria bacterium]|nr:ImmA/IrrE family metallo-endopeptidase [Deltaproteobacteria bacterium]